MMGSDDDMKVVEDAEVAVSKQNKFDFAVAQVQVRMPTPWQKEYGIEDGNNEEETENDVEPNKESLYYYYYLYCHGDGVAWRGLEPMLFHSPIPVAQSAISILLQQCFRPPFFLHHTPQQQPLTSASKRGSNKSKKTLNSASFKQSSVDPMATSIITGGSTNAVSPKIAWQTRTLPILCQTTVNQNHPRGNSSSSKKRKRRNCKISLVVVPPFFVGGLRPERLFSSRLVLWENVGVKLQTLNAFIATLGGGYFLCRQLSVAVELARRQRQVALAMNDVDLAARCTLNEAYNYIHAGEFWHAKILLRIVSQHAKTRKDHLTLLMTRSAKLFMKRVQRASLYEPDHPENTQSTQSIVPNLHLPLVGKTINHDATWTTHDDFQRIRISRDRSKLN